MSSFMEFLDLLRWFKHDYRNTKLYFERGKNIEFMPTYWRQIFDHFRNEKKLKQSI